MYGAIIGDMAGSPYEFDEVNKSKDIDLFREEIRFTDDTVMTAAVADALLRSGPNASNEKIRQNVIDSMQAWGHEYPDAGYGFRFNIWLNNRNPKPYGSFGNGSAMRVSPAGWLYETMERTREVARTTAEVTHDHPEGIKGAESVAAVIFMARNGESKDNIRKYVTDEFGYDLTRTCDEIRPHYKFDESCQKTVPEAITAFFEGNDFEDVIRTAASLGGDCDTLTCIAGSMAEAYYGVPEWMKKECDKHLTGYILNVIRRFYRVVDRLEARRHPEDPLKGNVIIEDAILDYYEDTTNENLARLLSCIEDRIDEQGNFLIPVDLPAELLAKFDPEKIKVGDTIELDEDIHFTMKKVKNKDGKIFMAAFTSNAEIEKGESTSVMSQPIEGFLYHVMNMQSADGVVINPWDKPFMLDKPLLGILFKALDEDKE